MLLYPASLSQSMSNPQKEQHVESDFADCYCQDGNNRGLVCINTSGESGLGNACCAEFRLSELWTRHEEVTWPGIEAGEETIICVQMII